MTAINLPKYGLVGWGIVENHLLSTYSGHGKNTARARDRMMISTRTARRAIFP
jgi:hypothetical protein